jgi:hypothetical protein
MTGAVQAAAPELGFTITGAEPLDAAVVPTLRFRLRVATDSAAMIRAVALNVQVRIAAAMRDYGRAAQERLVELFGTAERWGTTLQSLLWTQATLNVPAFRGTTDADLLIPCTYDFEVTAAKYLHALDDGVVPLELLFSGTIFYDGPAGLQTARVAWDRETRFALPVAAWRQLMDRYFPDSAWLRLGRDAFDQLQRFRAERALPTWDAAVATLLSEAQA